MAIYEVVETHVSGIFKKYGRFLSRHPISIMSIALLATAVLGIGLLKLESEKDLEYLYTPENCPAFKDRYRLAQLFSDRSEDAFYQHQISTLGLYGDIIIVGNNSGENVLSVEVLKEMLKLDDFIKNITVSIDNIEYGYLNVCARRFNNCVSSGIHVLINDSDISGFLNTNLTYPFINVVAEETVYTPDIMGGVNVDEHSIVRAAEALRVRYHLQTGTRVKEISLAWERAFLQKMAEWEGDFSTVAYSVSESLKYELNTGTSADVGNFAITFTIMSVYAGVVCGTGNCVTTRGFLANIGVYSAGLAILASIGFCSYIGVKFVNIVGVMPFLIIGIGIDDMFLLMSGLLQTSPSDTVEGRVSGAFGIAAVSVTITSLTDVLAFCIGATNVFPSLRNFCIYTGFALTWCYVLQLTVFGSAMVFHTRRVKSSRHCCTCTPIPSDDQINSGGKCLKCLCVFFCIGKKSNAHKGQDDRSIFERVPLYLSKMLLLVPVKIAVLLVFAGYLGVSIWGLVNLEQGLLLNNLVPPDSYLYSYLKLEREHFSTIGPVVAVVIQEPLNYWDGDVQKSIDDLLDSLQQNEYVSDGFRISWLNSFSDFHNGSLPTSQTEFLQSLQDDFLPSNPQLAGDVKISSDGTIKASRYYIRSEGLTSSYLQGRMMLTIREITGNSDLPGFAYTGAFVFFEQYVQVLPSTLLTVGIAVAAIFVVCVFFIPHILCVIYVTVTMVMILVGLFGFMHFWGLSLSSITMIHIVMSVGFTVDFAAHVCHAFMKADGMDRDDRIKVALCRVAAPIMNGGISSLLGIIVLVNATSYVFLSFFRIMLLTIVFGMAHALLFLPVLLSLVGPGKPKPNVEMVIQPVDLANGGPTSKKTTESALSVNGGLRNIDTDLMQKNPRVQNKEGPMNTSFDISKEKINSRL
ncbi:patched domain-containing protein 3-like [Glandiceps talaboti]